MKPEEEKQIIEAINHAAKEIARAAESTSEAMKRFCERIKQSALAVEPAAPVGKEYRAGEWVPTFGMTYWYYDAGAAVDWDIWQGDTIENVRLSSGNVFPTEAIAEAAKKHAEWWRTFDIADEGGKVSIWVWTTGGLHVLANNYKDSNPRWQSSDSARAWVESHGGEAYVSEMLTKGRVFRFKWGGE